MRSALMLAAMVATGATAQKPADRLAQAGLQAASGARPLQLDFDGDGKREIVVVATVSNVAGGSKVDDPWGRSVGKKTGGALRRGEKVLAITGPGNAVWALRDAVYEMTVPLRHRKPSDYDDCWKSKSRDAVLVGTEEAAGILAWNGKRFDWIQCGD